MSPVAHETDTVAATTFLKGRTQPTKRPKINIPFNQNRTLGFSQGLKYKIGQLLLNSREKPNIIIANAHVKYLEKKNTVIVYENVYNFRKRFRNYAYYEHLLLDKDVEPINGIDFQRPPYTIYV